MNPRTIVRIDVSDLSEQELCAVLAVPYVPWYRSHLFWCLALCLTMPSVMLIFEVLK